MYIELFGLPGTGKTTIVKNIVRTNHNYDNFFKGRDVRLGKYLCCIFRGHFIKFIFLSSGLLLKKLFQGKLKKRDLKTFSYIIQLYLKVAVSSNKDVNYIVDHGFVQCVISIIWDRKELIKSGIKIVKHLGRLSNIQWVYACNDDIDCIRKRIINRDESRRIKELDNGKMETVLSFQNSLFNEMYDILQKTGNTLRINTIDDYKRNSETITSFITGKR